MAALALAAVGREYPNHVALLLRGDDDLRPPRELTPAFFGSFDWHSAVHGHWTLARLARLFPDAPFAPAARAALARSLTAANLAREVAYVSASGREGFERPYGLAWLLQLAAELRAWDDDRARAWHAAIAPLEALAVSRLVAWLPKLRSPIRSGEHAQSAFAMGLMLDWARVAGDRAFARLVASRARAFHFRDARAPIAYEPSGHDFLSPALGEADLMRRVLAPRAFTAWFTRFLPDLAKPAGRRWLTPVKSPDPSDGKLSHLDGLNLSRAWMLEGVASALAPRDRRAALLARAARAHARAGLAAVTGEHYAGAHWLASFAVYLETGRGLAPSAVSSAP
ncbi:MAG: DUF2891 domain-containing protein [Candidatus Eisenbacteria bacterium]|nr:DUF2891 domain-containing protein [Candidatus Eisenbacteria bacterium]